MSDKILKIYETLIEGAEKGLTDTGLFQHVLEHCPKATSKKIVRAALLALTDPEVNDKNILDVVYALAIKHRLDPLSKDDIQEMKDKPQAAPKKGKKRPPKESEDAMYAG